MDIMEFLKMSEMVCDFHKQVNGDICRPGCPFQDVCVLHRVDLLDIDEDVIAGVQRCYDEKISCLKNRQQAYLAVFPKAPKDSKGVIDVCPNRADKTLLDLCEKYNHDCAMCRAQYWEGIYVTACMR